jgi:hypothetical protein
LRAGEEAMAFLGKWRGIGSRCTGYVKKITKRKSRTIDREDISLRDHEPGQAQILTTFLRDK